MIDPITSIFSIAFLLLDSSEKIDALIRRLTDRQRELADAERDRRDARNALDGTQVDRMAGEGGGD